MMDTLAHNRCPHCGIDIGSAVGTCGKRQCEIAEADAQRLAQAGEALGRAMANEAEGRRR